MDIMIKQLIQTCLVMMCFFMMAQSLQAAGLSFADNQVFAHGFTDISNMAPLSITEYPCGRSDKSLIVQTAHRSLYGLKELTDNRIAIALRQKNIAAGFGLASFGQPDYFHQMGASIFGNFTTRHFSLGSSISYHRLSFAEPYRPLSAVSTNIGLAYSFQSVILFGVSRNCYHTDLNSGDKSFPPEGECGISVSTPEGLISQAKALFIRDKKPTAELSQSIPLSTQAAISWALVLYPVRFGGGLHIEKSGFGFDYTYSHHAVLGGTHIISMSVFR